MKEVKAYRWASSIILLVIFMITAICLFFCTRLKFNYDFESFFPVNDPDLSFYLDFRNKFEYDNEFVLVGVENKEGIFRKDFLSKIQEFTDSVRHLKNISNVVSPTNIKNPVIGPLGIMEIPYLHVQYPERYADDSTNIYQTESLIGSLFAKNARSISIFIKTKEFISKNASDTLLFQLEELLHSFHFEKTHIAGKLKAQYVYIEKLRTEFILFLASSLVLLLTFLYISFRSLWGLWIPLLVVIISMIWTLGIMGMLGKQLDIMMVLLPTMIFIVGMSDVIHILSKYLEELRNGRDKFAAFKITLKEVGFPTFLTLLSTAAGFLVLLYSPIKPIRDFGIYTSLGVLIAFIVSFTLIPAIMLFFKNPIIHRRSNNPFWTKQLHHLLTVIFRNTRMISLFSLLLIIVSFWGISKIKTNNYLLEDLSSKDPLKKDFAFFENNYAGVRPFEMAVTVGEKSVSLYDKKVLTQLQKIESFLKDEYHVGFIVSPLNFVKATNKAFNGGMNEHYKIPADTTDLAQITEVLQKNKQNKSLKAVLSGDSKQGRITGKMHDIGSGKVKDLNLRLARFMKGSIDTSLLSYKITGTAALIDKSNEHVSRDMIQGILLSVIVVSLIISFVHRSKRMILVSILPNIIPLLMAGGLMGLAGIELKASTAIIFSIAFGIATDDTIHFLARLKLELAKGKSLIYAIKRTYLSTGKAIIVTSLILSAGFLSLMLSDFQSTFYFGLLVSLILLIAIIADLMLVPVLLLLLYGSKLKGKKIQM